MATLGSLSVKLGLDPSQFRNGLIAARSSLAAFKASINDGDKSTDKFVGTLGKLGKSAAQKALDLGKLAVQAGAVASAAITAAPYLVRSAQAIGSVGGAALQASPALLALGAAGEFVKLTMTRISQSVLRSLNPVVDLLNVAGDAASNVASKGLTQLSQGFARANLPAVRAGMVDIADATNTVVSGTLRWGQSTAGITAIRSLTVSTGLAMQSLAPHVVAVVTSFGNMIGRIAAVSTAAGASGLSGVLDRLAGWMDRVNAATVSSGIDKLKSAYEATTGAIESVVSTGQRLYATFQQNREAIGRVQDGLSLLALTTGPIGLVAGAVGLLARHWDEVKNTVGPFIGPFVAAVSNLLAQLSPLVPVIAQLVASFLQWGTIAATVLSPVLSVISSIIQFLGPGLAAVVPPMLAIIAAIKAWTIVQGILDALLLANPIGIVIVALAALVAIIVAVWSHIDTLRAIASGAFNALLGVALGAINGILGAFNGLVGWLAGIGGRILNAIGDLGGMFSSVGASIIRGIGVGIQAGWSYLTGLVSNLASSLFSAAKRALGISSPSKAFASVGANVGAGLAAGLLGSRSLVSRAMARLNAEVTPAAGGGLTVPTPRGVGSVIGAVSGRPIEINFTGGGPLEDALLRSMRKAVRNNGGSADAAFTRRR